MLSSNHGSCFMWEGEGEAGRPFSTGNFRARNIFHHIFAYIHHLALRMPGISFCAPRVRSQVAGYVRLARESLAACFDSSNIETAR